MPGIKLRDTSSAEVEQFEAWMDMS